MSQETTKKLCSFDTLTSEYNMDEFPYGKTDPDHLNQKVIPHLEKPLQM
jgi:hypothetical protein